jgi:zinc transporter 9
MAGKAGTKVILQAIGGNAFITIIKFIGFVLTASPSMMAEAVHSLADTFNQILLFIGVKQSESSPGEDYATGMGNARYVWNLVSAVGIFFIGFGVTFYHGMHSLLADHHESAPISWIAIGILVISFAIEFWVLLGAWREVNRQRGQMALLDFFRESDDPTVLAVLLEDGVAVLGVLLALIGLLLGQLTGQNYFDAVISIIISFLMAFLAISLGITNGKLLIGKRVSVAQESDIQNFIESLPQVQRVVHLNTKIIGSGQVRLAVEVELYGENLVDLKSLERDVQELRQTDNPTKVLLKSNERMIRVVGNHINEMEVKIVERFPEIVIIDLEIN